MDYYEDLSLESKPERSPDPVEKQARENIENFFNNHREEVFFFRQIEVLNEDKYFHWVTNRAIHDLIDTGFIKVEEEKLKSTGPIKLLRHYRYRYYKRKANQVISLVEEYADPNIAAAVGLNGEFLVLEGFARRKFIMHGRNINEYKGVKWEQTNHDLDFIFEKESISYGIEVKNSLAYMDYNEMKVKIDLCKKLKIRPVFIVRMMPKTWIEEIRRNGGFALI